jgi:RimJ/RimL family protein N-acetyltransferase
VPGERCPSCSARGPKSDALALREAIDEDLPHLKPWLGWTLEEPATLEETRVRLRRWAAQHRLGEGFRWGVVRPERPDVVLGGANLNRRVGPDAHDIGYWVRRSATRRGIASAAAARLVVHAFEDRRWIG